MTNPAMATALVVDDDSLVRDLVTRWLGGEGFHCLQADSAETAWQCLERAAVDLITLDMRMPGHSGLELLDEIGLDTALQSAIVLAEVFGERSAGSELLVRLVKAGQYGMKSGAGFYCYPGKTPNPSFGEIIAEIGPDHAPPSGELTDSKSRVAERLLRPMTAEAGRLLAEKQVAAPWEIDLAMIFGLGFPLWRGGLLWSGSCGLRA